MGESRFQNKLWRTQRPSRGNETSLVSAQDLVLKNSKQILEGGIRPPLKMCFNRNESLATRIRSVVRFASAKAFGDIGFVPSEAVQLTGQGDGVFVMRGCDQATRSEMDIC